MFIFLSKYLFTKKKPKVKDTHLEYLKRDFAMKNIIENNKQDTGVIAAHDDTEENSKKAASLMLLNIGNIMS